MTWRNDRGGKDQDDVAGKQSKIEPSGIGSGKHKVRIMIISLSLKFLPEMESKTARLTILIDPLKKKALEDLCAQQDLTPSQVVRQLIREYLDKHGADYATKVRAGSRQKT